MQRNQICKSTNIFNLKCINKITIGVALAFSTRCAFVSIKFIYSQPGAVHVGGDIKSVTLK